VQTQTKDTVLETNVKSGVTPEFCTHTVNFKYDCQSQNFACRKSYITILVILSNDGYISIPML